MWKIGNISIKNKVVFAPMAGISNKSYRKIIKDMGAGLIYSEMISNMGIVYNNKKTIDLLQIDDYERPIAVQIFGNDVSSFVNAAKYIENEIHPDIIDINMGCPVPKIAIKSQAGSSILKNPEKVYEIVKAVTDNVKIPVTVKMRIGWDENSINAVENAKMIEKAGAAAIAVHGRTRSAGYSGKVNLDIIKDVKENVNIPVIGNGDIKTVYDAEYMLNYTGCDAVMIGRGALGYPWFIRDVINYLENKELPKEISLKERIDMIKYHINLLCENKNETSALLEIRTFIPGYLRGVKNSNSLKSKICNTKSINELYKILDDFLKENQLYL